MQKKLRLSLLVVAALALASGAWLFRPADRYDPAKIAPELRDLKEPFRSVATSYWMDGGSLGIEIVDAQGVKALFCMPAPAGVPADRYQRLFYGAWHYTEAGAVELSSPHDTQLRLLEILRDAPNIDRHRDGVVAESSGRWSDRIRFWYRGKIHGRYVDH